MRCPNCDALMVRLTLDGHQGRRMDIDRCGSCHVFWFDQRESLQLSPRATLELFRVMGEQAPGSRQPLGAVLRCPHCASQLVHTHDRQRNVPFQYRRCPHGHGRLTTDFDFLREKSFIRPLSADQLQELRRSVAAVNCSNCGAPVDLARTASCAHCGSPLSMLDLRHASEVIAQLQAADAASRQVDPALPMRLEQARRDVEASFAAFERQPRGVLSSGGHDLVSAGIGLLAKLLTP